MKLIYEITRLPDLSLSKSQMFEDSGVDGMLKAQTQLIRQLHRISMLGGVEIHFLFDYDPERQESHRLVIYLLLSGSNDSYYSKLQKVIAASGVSGYFSFREVENFPSEKEYTYLAYLYKRERFLQTEVNQEEYYFYVVPNWELNDTARLYNLIKLMQSFNERVCYRVDLFTERRLEEKIHKNFEKPLTYLRNLSNRDRGISELSKLQQDRRDPNADETLHQYEDWLKKVDTNPVYKCNVCSLSDDRDYCQILLDSAVSENLKSGDADICVEQGRFSALYHADVYQGHYSEGAPSSMQEWPTTFTSEEIAAFVRFPVLYDGETVELPKETAPVLDPEGFVIGHDRSGYPVTI